MEIFKPMTTVESIWIIVPAYNEGRIVRSVIDTLANIYPNIVVVNDCSTDNTSTALKGCSAHILNHPLNLGQGAALQTGIDYALSKDARYIVTYDADGQHRLEDIPAIVAPLLTGKYDIALGSRFIEGGWSENLPKSRRFLLKCATAYTRFSTGLNLTDTHNGFRAMTAEAASKIRITQNRMAHASQILSQISIKKLRWIEVPVRIRYTKYSLQKGQKMANSFNIVWESVTEKFRL